MPVQERVANPDRKRLTCSGRQTTSNRQNLPAKLDFRAQLGDVAARTRLGRWRSRFRLVLSCSQCGSTPFSVCVLQVACATTAPFAARATRAAHAATAPFAARATRAAHGAATLLQAPGLAWRRARGFRGRARRAWLGRARGSRSARALRSCCRTGWRSRGIGAGRQGIACSPAQPSAACRR